jgi:hypothetical protein
MGFVRGQIGGYFAVVLAVGVGVETHSELNSFRIHTYKSLSKQSTLILHLPLSGRFRMTSRGDPQERVDESGVQRRGVSGNTSAEIQRAFEARMRRSLTKGYDGVRRRDTSGAKRLGERGRLIYGWRSTSRKPKPCSMPVTVLRALSAAVLRMPSCSAACWSWRSASTRTWLSRSGSGEENRPVSRE